MKIGVVCYPTFGGSGVVATELGISMARKGNDVHFITYERPARLDMFMSNVYYHEVTPFKYSLFKYAPYEATLAGRLVDVVINEKLDLLHVHYAIPHASVAHMAKRILASKGINIPVITTLHGTDITLIGKDPTLSPVIEYSINNSDGVTAVSEFLKEATYENFSITKDIEVIYNFIDFSKFKKTNKDHFKKAIAPDNEKVLTHISNFRGVKRAGDAVRAFKKIRETLPVKMLMIGDGPERIKLESQCREWGICEDIRFLGKQGAIEELLSISDLFMLPSETESFGLAALEAMSLGVPVVSTNVGGIPEVNIHGQTGLLNELGDVDTMASNAISILQDEETHKRYSENAYNKAQEFHVDRIIPSYEDLYHRTIEEVASA